MIIFDQLRISDDGSKMYINIHVNKSSYFKDIYIDTLIIMTADKVSETAPGLPTTDFIYAKKVVGNQKELNLVLTSSDFRKNWESDVDSMKFRQKDMDKSLFFVYVGCKGTPDASTPCTLDENTVVGVTFWENLLYKKVMDHTRDLAKDCHVPMSFIDTILLWNAFKASIETEHYLSAIQYFNMLFNDSGIPGSQEIVRRCGCHG